MELNSILFIVLGFAVLFCLSMSVFGIGSESASNQSTANTTSNTSYTNTTSSSAQTTGAGNEAVNSPTLNASSQGSVSYWDTSGAIAQDVAKAALSGMSDLTTTIIEQLVDVNRDDLEVLSGFAAQQVETNSSQQQASQDMLSALLKSQSTLAQNVQSGGATIAMESYKQILWGVFGLVAIIIGVIAYVTRKK